MPILLRSPAFDIGETIPKRHTGDGEDVSPALEWSGLPPRAAQLALIVDDPDAPTTQPWVHWLLYNMPATAQGLPEGFHGNQVPTGFTGLRQGHNSWGTLGYRGPAPPRGHGTHRYVFKLLALRRALDLPPGLDKTSLLEALEGQVLGIGEMEGTYERP